MNSTELIPAKENHFIFSEGNSIYLPSILAWSCKVWSGIRMNPANWFHLRPNLGKTRSVTQHFSHFSRNIFGGASPPKNFPNTRWSVSWVYPDTFLKYVPLRLWLDIGNLVIMFFLRSVKYIHHLMRFSSLLQENKSKNKNIKQNKAVFGSSLILPVFESWKCKTSISNFTIIWIYRQEY